MFRPAETPTDSVVELPSVSSAQFSLPADFRSRMPVTERWAYYDHAAVGPLSGPARDAITTWLKTATHDGDVHWPTWLARSEQLRKRVASGLNASVEEIAFVGNTTDGIDIVAQGIDWREGDNVVVPAGEFPSNHYPWRALEARGVELRVVPTSDRGRFDPDDVALRCDRRTRLITASWVGFASGFRCDIAGIAQVARDCGALFLLDAIQGLGVFPLDLARIPIDFVAADGHKWMLGPEGFGVLYVRRERIEMLRPSRIGWNSVRHPFDYQRLDFELRDDARRFEGGSTNFIGAHGLAASLDLLAAVGWGANDHRLADRILTAGDDLVERIRALGGSVHSDRRPEHSSGIISFSFPGHDPVELRRQALDQGVVLSCRAGRLRAAVHGYNDGVDADRFEIALATALGIA